MTMIFDSYSASHSSVNISKDLSIQRSLSHLFFYNHFFVIITRLNNLCRKLLPNKVSFLFIRQIILISIRVDNHRNSNNRNFLFMFYKNRILGCLCCDNFSIISISIIILSFIQINF
jgi:hypothetical protein